jgi:hypothetical protein
MKFENEFKEWLREKYPDEVTMRNRISNCRNVEKHYDLDAAYEKDMGKQLLNEEFKYSVADERDKKEPKHKVSIVGDLRTGTATLRQAIKLYMNFRSFLDENEKIESKKIIGSSLEETEISERKNEFIKVLEKFEFKKDVYIQTDKEQGKVNTGKLLEDLLEHFQSELQEFNWEFEYKPSDSYKDSVDIYGESKENDLKVIIELDPWRADQVSKKFTSRTSLFINHNLIYVSLCYPGTDKMNRNECQKYFEYCRNVSEFITKNTNITKIYIGYFLD